MAPKFNPIVPRETGAAGRSPINGGLRNDFGGAPLVLTASTDAALAGWNVAPYYPAIVGQPGCNGAVAVLDTTTLQPASRAAYWIDEIRIHAYRRDVDTSVADPDDPAQFPLLGQTGLMPLSDVGVKFATGHHGLMKDFVPAAVLGLRYGLTVDLAPMDEYRDSTGAITNELYFCESRWVLPKPLYMDAGDALQASVRNLGNKPISKIAVTYVGRVATPGEPPPATRCVPYVAAWRADAAWGSSLATTGQFRNPFSSPLWVQRMVARYYTRVVAGGDLPGWQYPTLPFDTTVRLYDSLGYAIVPDFYPAASVFDSARAAWTFARAIGPREQLDFQCRPGTAWSTSGFGLFGMVGYREEA